MDSTAHVGPRLSLTWNSYRYYLCLPSSADINPWPLPIGRNEPEEYCNVQRAEGIDLGQSSTADMGQHVLLNVSAPVAAMSNVLAVPHLHCSCSSNPVPHGVVSLPLEQELLGNMESALVGKGALVILNLTQGLVRAYCFTAL